jgi:hypothetical protein
MNRSVIAATIAVLTLATGCVIRQIVSEPDLVAIAKAHVEVNQKELTQPLSLGKYNPGYQKVEPTENDTHRVTVGYGSLAYDHLWIFTMEIAADGKVLAVSKEFTGYR